nr:peroxidase 64-like [Tanacetum cinerariifolium]
IVSCADILALAARDAVVLSGGPSWDVPKGRKDGRTSKSSETIQLPAPTFNISQLQQSFAQRGLSLKDLVALSEGYAYPVVCMIVWIEWVRLPSICIVIGADGYAYPGEVKDE